MKFKTIHEQPLIQIYSHVLKDEECDYIKKLTIADMTRAFVSNEATGFISESRTNDVAWLELNYNSHIKAICQRIAKIVHYPVEHAETMQVIRYGKKQEYQAHYDAYELDTATGKACTKHQGQRMLTCLIYLSEPELGGETAFPNLNVKVKPRKGFMLVFENCLENSTTRHPLSLHAGMPVIEGEKWACNLWFRQQAS